MFADMAQPQAM